MRTVFPCAECKVCNGYNKVNDDVGNDIIHTAQFVATDMDI